MAGVSVQNLKAFSKVAGILGFSLLSCGPRKVDPLPALPELPAYTQVEHPESYELSDIRAILSSPKAPTHDELKDCDAPYRQLETATPVFEERIQAVRELVMRDPVAMHWCFYDQLSSLHDFLKSDALWSERQKRMVATYRFLAPVAQAFRAEFSDSRYLRWAMKDYKRLSEWVFYRKLDLSPQATADLMEGARNPYALAKKPKDQALSIFEKYHIAVPEARAPANETGSTPEKPAPAAPIAATPSEMPVAVSAPVGPPSVAPAATPEASLTSPNTPVDGAPNAAAPDGAPAVEIPLPAIADLPTEATPAAK